MKLTITIRLDNAAFGDTPADRGAEVARILHNAATRLEHAVLGGASALIDANGNTCGSLKVTSR